MEDSTSTGAGLCPLYMQPILGLYEERKADLSPMEKLRAETYLSQIRCAYSGLLGLLYRNGTARETKRPADREAERESPTSRQRREDTDMPVEHPGTTNAKPGSSNNDENRDDHIGESSPTPMAVASGAGHIHHHEPALKDNIHFARHGDMPLALYDWRKELKDYGYCAEERRAYSLSGKNRLDRQWPKGLETALARRHKSAPSSCYCITCFTLISPYHFNNETSCCGRIMCNHCIEVLAQNQVLLCKLQKVPMEMPRCPACGYRPQGVKSLMRVNRDNRFMFVHDATNVLCGNINFVMTEKGGPFECESVVPEFSLCQVRFMKYFWKCAIQSWPVIEERNPSLKKWVCSLP